MGNAYTFDLKIIRYWDRKDYPEKVGNRLTGGYGKKDPPPGSDRVNDVMKVLYQNAKKATLLFPNLYDSREKPNWKKMTDFWKKELLFFFK